mmetsp:Transcript_11957/g.18474  ORF Transcript_11957/g.18474 Transcript_11957/m.18474 type:complete len:131 (+) Transcript_11957:211-603(+)
MDEVLKSVSTCRIIVVFGLRTSNVFIMDGQYGCEFLALTFNSGSTTAEFLKLSTQIHSLKGPEFVTTAKALLPNEDISKDGCISTQEQAVMKFVRYRAGEDVTESFYMNSELENVFHSQYETFVTSLDSN